MLGVSSSVAHIRRHRPSAAAAAYSLALSVVGDADAAASIAASSLRKGAGSLIAVIAHARRDAISAARPDSSVWSTPAASADLRELAQQLAATRPPIERAIVNLELRSSLDAGSFARVLGLPTSRAAVRGRDVANIWTAELDPAMMAWLGPGSCEALSVILREQAVWPRSSSSPVVSSVDSTGPVPVLRTGTDGNLIEPVVARAEPEVEISVGSLLSAAPVVHEHAQTCEVCAERLRLLTPVRTLIAQTPLEEVPQRVADAARHARRRLPAPLPPSIEQHRLDLKRLQVPAFGLIALAIVGVLGVVIYQANSGSSGPSQSARVARLVQDAPVSQLLGTPTIVTPGVKTASLANNGTRVINWTATVNQPWIKLSPAGGRIQPSQSISIAITATPPASGSTDAAITIHGDDGSIQTLQYATDGG